MASAGWARWRGWLIGAAVVLVAAVAVAVPVVVTSDWWNVDYAMAATAPRAATPTQPAAAVHAAWSAPGIPPAGTPVSSATVLTADRHEVTGRDPGTGAVRWHYRRGNAPLCSWGLANSTVVAVYRNGDSCSDLTGFDPDTGRRRWYRNADLGAHIDLASAPNVVLATDRTTITAFYSENGGDAWTYSRPGCTMGPVAGGSIGVLALVDCGRNGESLTDLDAYTGKQRWTTTAAGDDPQLIGVDDHVLVLSRIGGRPIVSLFTSAGHASGSITGHGLTAPAGRLPTGTLSGDRLVCYDGSRVLAIDVRRSRVAWSAPAVGPADIEGGTAMIPQTAGFAAYDVAGGRLERTIGRPPAQTAVRRFARIGPRVVVVGGGRTTVFG